MNFFQETIPAKPISLLKVIPMSFNQSKQSFKTKRLTKEFFEEIVTFPLNKTGKINGTHQCTKSKKRSANEKEKLTRRRRTTIFVVHSTENPVRWWWWWWTGVKVIFKL